MNSSTRLASLGLVFRRLFDRQYRKNVIEFLSKKILHDQDPIYLDYPISVRSRYGWNLPPHSELYELIDSNRHCYIDIIDKLSKFTSYLKKIPVENPNDLTAPFWRNGYLGGLNAVALSCFPVIHGSRLYIEIGSGNSTKFIRKSVSYHELKTRLISIDPEPRAEIDALCNETIRMPLEEVDLSLFDQLESGDVLFVDGSHRCFQNSDVTVVFLEILPRLKSGVVIYIDDVYLPWDYPPEWSERYYSEQYLLAVMLLADRGRRYEVLLPHVFVEHDPELNERMQAVWRGIGVAGGGGNGMWLRVRAPRT